MSEKLSALVAEHVMKKRYWREARGEYRLCVGEHLTIQGQYVEPWKESRYPEPERYKQVAAMEAQKIGFYGEGIKPYSTRLGPAWEVVEKVLEFRKDTRFSIYFGCELRPTARFFVVATGADLALEHAATVPLAICLAALRAVGVDENTIQEAMR